LRRDFAYSASQIVKAYDLDGVDIDWEYPGLRGDNNSFRPEDKQNYTLMFEAIRKSLDSVQAIKGKKYLVSTAVGGFSDFISHTEMDKVQKYLDFVNIMSYDFKTEADTLTGHHTNLYSATHEADEQSGDRSVREFMAAGVPASKIVLGIAFYGRGF
jgi:chitinase